MTRRINPILCIVTTAVALIALAFSCKKDEDPNVQRITFEREYLDVRATSVRITGICSYPGKIDGITVQVGRRNDFADAHAFEADTDGVNFSVEITGLASGTEYKYRYEVDYGFSKPFVTETKTFTTQSESPTVQTLEVLALDSTTFRIKCEVLSGGGQEVTERGICWNNYGDPTLDDETMQHASGGIGQYTIRMENLATNTAYYVRAYAKSAAGIGFGEELNFRTGGSTTTPSVSTVEISNVTYNAAQCLGNITSDGGLAITERGVCWGLEPDPTVNVHKVPAESTETGNYTVTIDGLTPNTNYHVRAYAINEKGVAYGEDLTFKTTDGKPTVTTSGITDITATSAKGGGEVTDQGASVVTERGICWSTSHEPVVTGNHATNGTGAGSFTCNMTNLTPNESYYVRAYATNTQGTAYGPEVEFTAKEGLPSVLTLDVTDIAATTAKGHGKVTDQGGSAVTERGMCWGTEPSPTIEGSHANSGTGAGEFEISMTNLSPGTTYYVRAYAKNSQGLTYGEQKDFKTEATLPTVTTGNINGTTVSGNVTSDGGATVTERGICWSATNDEPTVADTHASNGTGTGSYTVELTDLEPGTTYHVRAYATNEKGTAYGEVKTLTTEANPPTVTTGGVSNIQQTTAQGSGNVTDDGGSPVTERGVCWSTSHNPTISGSHAVASGGGTGSFNVNMTGLTANTHYYVRAYAKNSAGKIGYGAEVDFTTSQNISAPTVTTSQVTNILQTTATGGGNVTATGGATVTERGICWSTSHNPTTSGSHASNGTGTGSYTVNMTGLTAGTTYYVRAYAINSAGTSYGSEVSFTTQVAVTVPTVTTSQVTNIQQTTATGGGNVTNSGGATVTARGVCWNTNSNPTISNSHTTNGTGSGSFTSSITGLTPGTLYHVRAYATNSAGTAYGPDVTFTTLSSGGNAPQGAINGQFTINASGDKVYFSQGNLQYQASTNTWRFAENQWDYVGNHSYGNVYENGVRCDNEQVSSTYNGWIDLFGWGTSGYHDSSDPYNVNYQPWSTSTDSVNETYNRYGYGPSTNMPSPNLTGSSAQYDWGVHNTISNTIGQWRTLTKDEWVYLFQGRSNASSKYGHGHVDGTGGMILLPDSWTLPSGLSFTPGNGAGNNYTSTQWAQMQANGAVFLPVTGMRDGTYGNLVFNVNSEGNYWSASYVSDTHSWFAIGLYFSNEGQIPSTGQPRYLGLSVRLVCLAQ